jgi:hypothetical protein
MRIPLIVAARMSEGAEYPRVALRPGKWTFDHNVTSSEVIVTTPSSVAGLHEELHLEDYTNVSISCVRAGSESSVTIFACLSH